MRVSRGRGSLGELRRMCACSKGVSPKTTRHKGRKLEAMNVSDACEHWCDERLMERCSNMPWRNLVKVRKRKGERREREERRVHT